MHIIKNSEGSITYLNSGDWVENLSALEFTNGEWSIYKFNDNDKAEMILSKNEEDAYLNSNQLFENMLKEFKLMRQ